MATGRDAWRSLLVAQRIASLDGVDPGYMMAIAGLDRELRQAGLKHEQLALELGRRVASLDPTELAALVL